MDAPLLTELTDRAPSLEVRSRSGAYAIRFVDAADPRAWRSLGSHVVCDRFFEAGARGAGVATLPIVPIDATEAAKDLEAMPAIIRALRDHGLNRQGHVVALGGGVVQDVVTFAASVYMRGVAWTYVPTTLMAMADSCIGGKSSINVGAMKNLVGTFHPPRTIAIDPAFLATLARSEICAGLAEAAKICFCRGTDAFAAYLALAAPVLEGDVSPERVRPLLVHVLRAKIWFIEKDEFDRAERRLLNFGHTWGHALEASTDFAVSHGLAVAIGVLAASRFAGADAGAGAREDTADTRRLVDHCRALVAAAGATVPPIDDAKFWAAFRGDKKHRTETYQVIVPAGADGAGGADGLGVREVSVARDAASEASLRAALDHALGDLR